MRAAIAASACSFCGAEKGAPCTAEAGWIMPGIHSARASTTLDESDKAREAIRAACGSSDRVATALSVVATLDNEESELLSHVLALVLAAQGRPRWRLLWINGRGEFGWLTVQVEVPKARHDDPRLGPFSYPCASYEDAKEHHEDLVMLEVDDRYFRSAIGDERGRWRLEDVPAWVMKSIEDDRIEREARRAKRRT